MTRSSARTYDGAMKILARGSGLMDKFDRVLGGLLIAGAPLTAGATLALLDPKSEFIALLRDLTGTAPSRIKSSSGKSHYELIEAAHTVLVLTSFFEAMQENFGREYSELKVTEAEMQVIAERAVQEISGHRTPGDDVPMPSALQGFIENLDRIRQCHARLLIATQDFLQGLGPAQRMAEKLRKADGARVIERSMEVYRDAYLRISAELPEFQFWAATNEHAATRQQLTVQIEKMSNAKDTRYEALLELNRMLLKTTLLAGPTRDVERKLAVRASTVLKNDLLRTSVSGLVSPPNDEGFIGPDFRVAMVEPNSQIAEEAWWQGLPRQGDIAAFLAKYMVSPDSTRLPLVILGHPGAGKTLLSQMIAARLPTESFTPILVRLRRVDADAEIHQQIESALESLVREQVSWGQLCRDSATTKVVILDGFDELMQATGVAQSRYIEKVARFQRDELADGHSVILIVTSRMLVMDRVRVPVGTIVVKLEHFSDDQVERWIKTWNLVNRRTPSYQALIPDDVLRLGDFARQPLILTLLAIYAAEERIGRLYSEEMSGAELYKRLLDSFIVRQITEKAKTELSECQMRDLQRRFRRDLAIAAFAMFNRGQQFVSEEQLEQDLNSLSPVARSELTSFGEPLSRARSTVAAFFFIYTAQSDEHVEDKAKRTYEFLHATFGEYLIAEYAVLLLGELSQDRERLQTRITASVLDDGELRSLLSHRPLMSSQTITTFAQQLILSSDKVPSALRQTALQLYGAATKRKNFDDVGGYSPTEFNAITRMAAYSANLLMLALTACTGVNDKEIPVADLDFGRGMWQKIVYLWRAGLKEEDEMSVLNCLARSGDAIRLRREGGNGYALNPVDVAVAELVGNRRISSQLTDGFAAREGGTTDEP